jgi:Cu(I)/Ag(I) efflux system membrane protein CusA/SilA
MDLGNNELCKIGTKFALQTVPSGCSSWRFEKQYQLVLDPLKMQYYNVHDGSHEGSKTSNNDVGGRKFEMSNMSYIVGLHY